MTRRVVNMGVLPGESTVSGAGRTCIHLFVQDERGAFIEPHALHPELDEHGEPLKQRVVAGPARGRLACDPKKKVSSRMATGRGNSVFNIVQRTDDPRAVTCPKCLASPERSEKMKLLEPQPAEVSNQEVETETD